MAGDLPHKWYLRLRELNRLKQVLHVPIKDMLKGIAARKGDPLTPVIVKEPVGEPQIRYLKEHQNEFRGLGFQDSFLRHYPHGPVAPQLLGYVSEVSTQELKQHPTGVVAGDKIGQAGIESAFDAYLRGVPGSDHLRVDSLGRPLGPVAHASWPIAGQRGQADARHAAAEGGAARPRVRHAARARFELLRLLGRERRRDRRARPKRRLGARARVGADVQPGRLLGPRHHEGARGRGSDRRKPRARRTIQR